MSQTFTSYAPGRVNIIGEHTDYTGGLVFPMALNLGITITGRLTEGEIHARSSNQSDDVHITLPVDPREVTTWGRYLAAAAMRAGANRGFDVDIESNLPAGGTGLSTSSALTCAALLALAGDGDRRELAKMARESEQDATGVQIGLMDQLSSLCGVEGSALLIDCHDLRIDPVVVPARLEILIVHSGQEREIAASEYSARREACFAAEKEIGPLRLAALDDVETLTDPTMKKRARHVVGDNQRVRMMADAFAANDIVGAAEILTEGHRSYADNFEASTPVVEDLVTHLVAQPGILAARLTGGGFGGSIVAFAEPGANPNVETWWTRATPSQGAQISWTEDPA
ncbi:MAG: galactokinase [Acidimicrobiales bacterium]